MRLMMSSDSTSSSQAIIVTGIVHPRGSGGVAAWQHDDTASYDKIWKLGFEFETWRDEVGDLHSGTFRVSQIVSREKLRDYMDRITGYTIISIRAAMRETDVAELLEVINFDVTTDDSLLQRVTELKKPVTHVDQRFGTLTLNRRVNWYEGTAIWAGKPITFTIDASIDTEIEAALRTATTLWDDEVQWNQRIQDYAVQELLPIKNEYWLNEYDDENGNETEEAPLTENDFKSRMTLKSITISPDGSFDFWHHDGDMFFGHSVWVTGNLTDGPTRADIPG